MPSKIMCSSIGRREELDVQLHLVREKRRIEQIILKELSEEMKNNNRQPISSAEMGKYVREKVEEKFPSGIDFYGRATVYINDEVHVKDDPGLLSSTERILPVCDSLKRIYLGERGFLHQVIPSFHGRPAATIRFADGAQKTFFLECLDCVGVRKSASHPPSDRASSHRTVLHWGAPLLSSKTSIVENGDGDNQQGNNGNRATGMKNKENQSVIEEEVTPGALSSSHRVGAEAEKEDTLTLSSLDVPSRAPLSSSSWEDLSRKYANIKYGEKQTKASKLLNILSKWSQSLEDEDDNEKKEHEKTNSTTEKKTSQIEGKDDSFSLHGRSGFSALGCQKKDFPPALSSLTSTAPSVLESPPPPLSLKELRQTLLYPPPGPSSLRASSFHSQVSSTADDNGDSPVHGEKNSNEAESFLEEEVVTGASSSLPFAMSFTNKTGKVPVSIPCLVTPLIPPETGATSAAPSLSYGSLSHYTLQNTVVLDDKREAESAIPLSTCSAHSSGAPGGKPLAEHRKDPIRIVNFQLPGSKTVPFSIPGSSKKECRQNENGETTSSSSPEVANKTGEQESGTQMRCVFPSEHSRKTCGIKFENPGSVGMDDPCWWMQRRSLGGGGVISNTASVTFGTTSNTTTSARSHRLPSNPTSVPGGNDSFGGVSSGNAGEKKENGFYSSSHAAIPPLTLQVIDSDAPLPDEILKTLDREAESLPTKASSTPNPQSLPLPSGTSDSELPSSFGNSSSSSVSQGSAKKFTFENIKFEMDKSHAKSSMKNVPSHAPLGLVKHHLPPPTVNNLKEKKNQPENLGTPYTIEQLKTIGVAELLSPHSSFGEVDEDARLGDKEEEIPPLLEENMKLTGIPQTAPPGYKGKFSFYDTNTSIPRYVPVKPSTLRRIMVAGFPRPLPAPRSPPDSLHSLPLNSPFPSLRFVEVYYRRDASMESILGSVTKALGWGGGNDSPAERLFTMAGNEVLWEENIVQEMQLIATQGNLYHPQRSSTEVVTVRGVDGYFSSSSYAIDTAPLTNSSKVFEINEKNRWKRSIAAEEGNGTPEAQKPSFVPEKIHSDSIPNTLTELPLGSGAAGVEASCNPAEDGRGIEKSRFETSAPAIFSALSPSCAWGGTNSYVDPDSYSFSTSFYQETPETTNQKVESKPMEMHPELDFHKDFSGSTAEFLSRESSANIYSRQAQRSAYYGWKDEEANLLHLPEDFSSFSSKNPNGLRSSSDVGSTIDSAALHNSSSKGKNNILSCSQFNNTSPTAFHSNNCRNADREGFASSQPSDPRTFRHKIELEEQTKRNGEDSMMEPTPRGSSSLKKQSKLPKVSLSGIKPFHIKVFENGFYDDDEGVFRLITVRSNYKTIGALKSLIARELGWRGGKKVDLLFDATGSPITHLDQLHDGDALVASAGDRFIVPYPNSILHREAARRQLMRQNEH